MHPERLYCIDNTPRDSGLVAKHLNSKAPEPSRGGAEVKPRTPNSISPCVHQPGSLGGVLPRYIAAKPVGQVAGQFADVPFPVVHSLAPVADPPSQHPDWVGTAPTVWANALVEINTVPVTTAATIPALNGLIPFNIAPEPQLSSRLLLGGRVRSFPQLTGGTPSQLIAGTPRRPDCCCHEY